MKHTPIQRWKAAGGAIDLLECCQTVLARLDLEAKERGENAVFPCAAMRSQLREAIAKAT